MKKNFKFYVIGWAVLLALFNLVAFLVPTMSGDEKFTTSFWIAYAIYTVSLIGNLICAGICFNDGTASETFYTLSFINPVVKGSVASFAVAIVCMAISIIPYWLGSIVCAIILVSTILSITKSKIAVDEVKRIDEQVKVQTHFIKSFTIDAETLMESAKDEAIKAECRKVAEALRYSDPMSSDALASVESAITIKFADLQIAVQANNKEKSLAVADELIILIGDRNKKCKLLK